MSDVYLWETYEKVGKEALERRDIGQAVESFRAAVTLAESLPGETTKLVTSLRHLSQANAKGGQLSMAFDLLKKTEELAQERLGGNHPEIVQIQRDLYDLARQLGYLEQAEHYLAEVLAAVRARGESAEFLEVLELLAGLAGERDRWSDAVELYQQLVDARAELLGEDDPGLAQSLLLLSTAQARSGQGANSEASLGRAFTLLEQQFADDPRTLAGSLLAGAELLVTSGHLERALDYQKRALDLLSSVEEESHPSLWEARECIGASLAGLGQLDEAIEVLEYCLRHHHGEKDYRVGGLTKNLAGLYLTTGKLDRAEELYQQASTILSDTLGPDHPATLATTEERIQLYHFTGRSDKALELALTTIRGTEQRYGAGHPSTAQVYVSTALLAHACQKWETAYQLMKAAEAIWETLTPIPHDVLANGRLNLATLLIEMERFDEASALLDQIPLVAGHPNTAVVEALRKRFPAPLVAEDPFTVQLDDNGLPLVAPEVPTEELSSDELSTKESSPVLGSERRRFERYNLGLNRFFNLHVTDAEDQELSIQSFLVDISAGGLRINSAAPLPAEKEFSLTLPSELMGEDLTFQSRVIWQRPLFGTSYLQGVEFLEASWAQKSQLESVLQRGDFSGAGRQHYRLYRPFSIAIKAGDEEWVTAYASDLSLEGLGTRLGHKLQPGQAVRVRLNLDFELPTVEVGATVAWSHSSENGYSHGLQFHTLEPVEAKTIKLYIDRCLELSPD